MKRASLLGALGALGLGVALFPAAGALAAPAAPAATGPVTYHGTIHQATGVAISAHPLSRVPALKARHAAGTVKAMIPFRSPAGAFPAGHNARAQASLISASGPVAAGSVMTGSSGVSVVHAFNGLNDADQAAANGGPTAELTPPDQGLCVGPAGSKKNFVFEIINSALRVTTPNGTLVLGDVPFGPWFGDPFAFSDPRCLFDPSTKTFFFTVIGFPKNATNPPLTSTTVDVAVLNAKGLEGYQFDTSLNGQCLGDQPKTGFTSSQLVVSTDEFCGQNLDNFEGAIVLTIPKGKLVAEAPTVSDEQFGPVSLAGIPVLGLDPAINTGVRTGYLVNSFPFTAAGNNNPVSRKLGLWRLNGDTLSGRVIRSERYAFPVPAASTGDGSVTNQITSEKFLDPGDSRLSGPVNVTRTASGDVQLWTALDSAIVPEGDSTARDGAAWFKIDTGKHEVVRQGYVAAKGDYLLYPALQQPHDGPAGMVVSATSPTLNPSSAFTTLGSGKVRIVAAGTGPHFSFSDAEFGTPRWGDYSFTALNPGTNGIWMATEYIPPAPSGVSDNWGTSVFEISG